MAATGWLEPHVRVGHISSIWLWPSLDWLPAALVPVNATGSVRFGATVHFPKVARAPCRDIYVVWVPQSTRAPHMAAEHRFYKRFNFESVPVEEYEVRYVSRSFLFPACQRSKTGHNESEYARESQGGKIAQIWPPARISMHRARMWSIRNPCRERSRDQQWSTDGTSRTPALPSSCGAVCRWMPHPDACVTISRLRLTESASASDRMGRCSTNETASIQQPCFFQCWCSDLAMVAHFPERPH